MPMAYGIWLCHCWTTLLHELGAVILFRVGEDSDELYSDLYEDGTARSLLSIHSYATMCRKQSWPFCSLREYVAQFPLRRVVHPYDLQRGFSKSAASWSLAYDQSHSSTSLPLAGERGQLATLYHTSSPDPWSPARGLILSTQPILYKYLPPLYQNPKLFQFTSR